VYTRIDYLRTGELFGNIYVPPVHLEAPLSIPSPSPCIWRQAPPSSAPHPHLYIVVLYVIRVQAVCVELTMPLGTARRPYSRTFSCVRDYCIRQYACDCILVFLLGCFQNKISSVAFLIPMPIQVICFLSTIQCDLCFYFLLYILRRFNYHGNV